MQSNQATPPAHRHRCSSCPQALAAALLCAGCGLVIAAPAIQAQSASDDESAWSLDPISVTGETPAAGDQPAAPYAGGQTAGGGRVGILGQRDSADVPFNVISFTGDLVDDQQADTVADVVRNDASVQTTSGFGNYAERYVVRGFVLNGEDLSFGGLYGVLPRQIVGTSFAERVEVFKGANAFANGVPPSGTGVGGAINLEPKRAEAGRPTELRFGFRSDALFEAEVDSGRRFGDDDQFGLRVNLRHGDGDTAINGEELESTGASVALDYRGERARASLDLGYQDQNYEGGRTILQLDGGLTELPEPPDGETNYGPSWNFSDLETVFGMLRGEYDLTDAWTVYGAVGANDTEELGQYGSPTVINAAGDATVGRLGVPYEADAFTGQGGLRGEFLTGPVSHSVNLGYAGYYRRTASAYTIGSSSPTNIYDPADVAYPPTTFADGDFDDPSVRNRTRADGVALSDTLGFMDDRVLLTLGARHQDIQINNYDYQGGFENGFSEDTVSPLYGLVIKPWRNVSLYANHIEALQPGDSAPTNAANAGQSIGIREAEQNELGVKYDTGAYGASASVFEIEQPAAFVDPATNVYGYNGEQRNRGLEFSLYGAPVDGLRVLSSASWLDAELRDTENGQFDGNNAVGVSEYRLVLGGEWDLPDSQRWTATGRVVHSGPQYADQANDLEIDAWTRIDAGLRYSVPVGDRTLVWRGAVENLASEDYWQSAYGGYLVQGSPRTYKLSATMRF